MGNGLGVFGLEAIKLLREKFSAFPEELELFRSKILNSRKYKDWLVSENLKSLSEGIRPDGTRIEKTPTGRQKSNLYERYTKYKKEKAGKISEYVTLKDKGDLYSSLRIKSGAETLYFEFLDPKYPEIERIWGSVKGITEEQKSEFIQMLYLDFLKFVNAYFKKVDRYEIIPD